MLKVECAWKNGLKHVYGVGTRVMKTHRFSTFWPTKWMNNPHTILFASLSELIWHASKDSRWLNVVLLFHGIFWKFVLSFIWLNLKKLSRLHIGDCLLLDECSSCINCHLLIQRDSRRFAEQSGRRKDFSSGDYRSCGPSARERCKKRIFTKWECCSNSMDWKWCGQFTCNPTSDTPHSCWCAYLWDGRMQHGSGSHSN